VFDVVFDFDDDGFVYFVVDDVVVVGFVVGLFDVFGVGLCCLLILDEVDDVLGFLGCDMDVLCLCFGFYCCFLFFVGVLVGVRFEVFCCVSGGGFCGCFFCVCGRCGLG